MKRPYAIVLPTVLLLAVVSCQGPQYITSDPTILLNYQKDPSHETLDALNKSYLNTINQNRKTGRIEPGLYSDYAVTLYLLGKPEAATSWFNKEVATFPYTAEYIRQLREDLEVRFNGADPTQTRRHSIEDIQSMDQIVELRSTENRQPSQLTQESMREAELKSREAVRGLDKPLTSEEKKALRKAGMDNRRQEKAAQENKFSVPMQAGEMAAKKTMSEETMQSTKAKNNKGKKGLLGKKKQQDGSVESKVTIESDSVQNKVTKSKKIRFDLLGKKRRERLKQQKAETENRMDDKAKEKEERIEEKAMEKAAARAEKKVARQKMMEEKQAANEQDKEAKKANMDQQKAEKKDSKSVIKNKKNGKKKRKQEEDKDFNEAFGD